MIKRNGNGEVIIFNPKVIVSLLVIFGMLVSVVSFAVGQNFTVRNNEKRINSLEQYCSTLDESFVPRKEMEVNNLLIAEQLNRIEQKIDERLPKK